MTRVFDKDGNQIPVTLVKVLKNTVSDVSGDEGSKIVEISSGDKKRLNKPEKGRYESLNIKPEKVLHIKTDKDYKVKDQIGADIFAENESIFVTGISKGKGFSGTVKRHNFRLGPKTHGSNNYRQPGSIGSMYPQRVVKGRRMSGHLGYKKTTAKQKIFKIEDNIIYIIGAVPGPTKNKVVVWSNIAKQNNENESL